MNAKATARPAPTSAPAEPTWTDAVAVIDAARVEGARELTAEEQHLISRARSQAGRVGELAIAEAGRLYDIAASRREVQAQYAASERAEDRRKSFLASREPRFRALPPFLQLAWHLVETQGGRASREGRELCSLLERLADDLDAVEVPHSFMVPPPGLG
jgi:hypothetical protein